MFGRSFFWMRLREGFLLSLSMSIVGQSLRLFDGWCYVSSVGAHFIYASWYKKSELGTRAAVFVCFGHLGSMAGGWIQAGLVQSLAGKSGLPAWRWIFIIVSVITIPTAIFGKFPFYLRRRTTWMNSKWYCYTGWFFIPDLPSHRNAWYLTKEEREHAATRLGHPKKFTWDRTVFKRVLLSWQFWLLPTIFMRESIRDYKQPASNTANIKLQYSIFFSNSDGTQ